MDMSMAEYDIWKHYFQTHPDINSYFMHLIQSIRLSQCVDVKHDSFIPYWLKTNDDKVEVETQSKVEQIAILTQAQQAFNRLNKKR